MKKIIIIIGIIVGLIIINFANFLDFQKNNGSYKNANSLYKQGKYREALNTYKLLKNKNSEVNYNIGNTIYKIAEAEKDSKLKINYLEKSLDSYRKALKIKFDEETKKNLEFVQEKIKQEKEKLKKAEEEQKKKEKAEKKENEKNDSESSSEGQSKKELQNNEDGDGKEKSGKNGENREERKLSKEGEKFIEDYEKKLKQEEKQNQKYCNKVYKEDGSKNIFDNFEEIFGNSQFDNSLLDKNEKKDW